MKYPYRALILILLLSTLQSMSQRKEIDSLSRLLQTPVEGTLNVDILNELAYQFVSVNADTAILYAGNALEMAEQLDYKKGIAVAYGRFGSAYFSKAQDDLSLESYLKSLKMSEEQGDSVNLCFVYQGLGIIYDVMGQEEDAIATLEKALILADKLSLDQRKTHIYLSLSIVSNQIDEKDKAMMYVRNSLKISEDINYVQGKINALNFLATLYIHQERLDEALTYLQRSLLLSKESGNPRRANYALIRIGRIYTKRGDYRNARRALDEAVENCQRDKSYLL